MTTRRAFLASLAAVTGSATLHDSSVIAADRPRVAARPDPKLFQTGDLVWPKKPGAYVQYHAGSANSPDEDRKQWLQERDAYLARMNAAKLDDLDRERVKLLQNMEYREFLAVYEGDQAPGVPGAYSGGAVYVGHVGIIDIDKDGYPYVVEAMLNRGVIRSTYEDWLAARPGHLVWLGRINGISVDDRVKVAAAAKVQLGKPYAFWNFDLNDAKGFYCSKLVWFSVYRALGFALDGKTNPQRLLWLSPKQVLYLPRVDRLHDPGSYGSG